VLLGPVVYHFVPAVLALAAWEVMSVRRLPVVTVGLCVWLALAPNMIEGSDTFTTVWLGGMLMLVIDLVRGVFAPAAAPASAPLHGLSPIPVGAHPFA
jgi:hypothetical protein